MLTNHGIRGAAIACLALMLFSYPLHAEKLSLRQAVDIAIENNPSIAAGRLSSEAAEKSARGARALTNPEVVVAPSFVGDAGSDSVMFFSQPLEANGSRRARGSIASYRAAAAVSESDIIRRGIVLEVSRSYWDTAQAQELARLSEDNVEYLEAVRSAVQKQYSAGAVPGSQILKMDVELARARQELAQAQMGLNQAKTALNALMNRPAAAELALSDPLVFLEVNCDGSALRSAALKLRPEMAVAQAQLSAAQAEVRFARLLRSPDLALQARKSSFDSDSENGLAIAVNIPIVDWGSAKAEKERAATAAQAQEKHLEATRNSVSLEVELAAQRVNTAAKIVLEYQGGILEKSEQLAAMARKGYEKGASSYLEVLEAQRTHRSIRSAYYSALAEHAIALAQLEWASGGPIQASSKAEVKK